MVYLTYEVFLTRPSKIKVPSINITSDFEVFGNIYDKQQKVQMNLPVSNYEFEFFQNDQGERQSLYSFFDNKKGRNSQFWLPSFKQDVVLTQSEGLGGGALYIQNINFSTYYSQVPKHLLIRYAGQDFACKVASAQEINSLEEQLGITPVLTLDTPLNTEINFLTFVRFDQDDLVFNHLENGMSSCTIKFKELVREYP